ncbi:MAG: macro domain-containing protein [Oscillospiraceae bacterium]|nr:macro domain-containing protein [Oscillospiraceae bacterium]
MPLYMIRGDIEKIPCDAIVSADTASGTCSVGEAVLSAGTGRSAGCSISTAAPVWQGGTAGEAEALAACYRDTLSFAAAHQLGTVAVPLISAGANGYPRKQAQEIAVREIARFLENQDMTVYLVQHTPPEGHRLYPEIDRLVSAGTQNRNSNSMCAGAFAPPSAAAPAAKAPEKKRRLFGLRRRAAEAERLEGCADFAAAMEFSSLAERIRQKDESFSEMLLRKIDESGMTDAECYKKANIDRKLFSKIRSDPHYQPKKVTALAFAIALELPLDETNAMLQAAGFAFSHSNTFDLIVEYFIRKGIYNVFTINEVLYEYDQLLIGA